MRGGTESTATHKMKYACQTFMALHNRMHTIYACKQSPAAVLTMPWCLCPPVLARHGSNRHTRARNNSTSGIVTQTLGMFTHCTLVAQCSKQCAPTILTAILLISTLPIPPCPECICQTNDAKAEGWYCW